MRSRPHVVIARLDDRELAIYERLLKRVRKAFGRVENDSDAFRKALLVMDEELKFEAMVSFYENSM